MWIMLMIYNQFWLDNFRTIGEPRLVKQSYKKMGYYKEAAFKVTNTQLNKLKQKNNNNK